MFLTTALMTAAAISAPAAPVNAQAQFKGETAGRMCHELSCTAQQREAIKKIHQDFKLQTKDERTKISKLRQQLADEYAKPNPSKRKLKSIYSSLYAAETKISNRVQVALGQVHATLDQQQRAALAKRIAERGPRRAFKGKGRDHHKGKRRGPNGRKFKGQAKGKGKGTNKGQLQGRRFDRSSKRDARRKFRVESGVAPQRSVNRGAGGPNAMKDKQARKGQKAQRRAWRKQQRRHGASRPAVATAKAADVG